MPINYGRHPSEPIPSQFQSSCSSYKSRPSNIPQKVSAQRNDLEDKQIQRNSKDENGNENAGEYIHEYSSICENKHGDIHKTIRRDEYHPS